jgi:hypothetical protein
MITDPGDAMNRREFFIAGAAVSVSNAADDRTPNRVIIEVRDGTVEQVHCDAPGLKVIVVNHDCKPADSCFTCSFPAAQEDNMPFRAKDAVESHLQFKRLIGKSSK